MLSNIGVTVAWQGTTIEGLDAVAIEADRLGFGYFWIPEAWGLEAFATASSILSKTSCVRVGTGIINVYSRSAALIGMSCVTLDQIAPNRFVLGLGSSGRALVEDWHGLKFSKPLKRTEEYVRVIRSVISGEQVKFDGQTFGPISRFRLFTKPIESGLEIYLGALGDRNLRLAGKICQGAILTMYPTSKLDHVLTLLNSTDISVPKKLFTYLHAVISTNQEELQKARKQVAKSIAFYVTSMGKYYARSLTNLGYDDEVERIIQAKEVKVASDEVSEELVTDLSLVGPPEEIIERISKLPRGVIPVLALACKSKDEVISSIASLGLLASYVR